MSTISTEENNLKPNERSKTGLALALCPVCNNLISALPGTRNATCHVCGFKDPCCE